MGPGDVNTHAKADRLGFKASYGDPGIETEACCSKLSENRPIVPV